MLHNIGHLGKTKAFFLFSPCRWVFEAEQLDIDLDDGRVGIWNGCHIHHIWMILQQKKSTETVLWNIHDLIISIISFKLAKSSQRKNTQISIKRLKSVESNKLIFFITIHIHTFVKPSILGNSGLNNILQPTPLKNMLVKWVMTKKPLSFHLDSDSFLSLSFHDDMFRVNTQNKDSENEGYHGKYHPKISMVLQLRHQCLCRRGEEILGQPFFSSFFGGQKHQKMIPDFFAGGKKCLKFKPRKKKKKTNVCLW